MPRASSPAFFAPRPMPSRPKTPARRRPPKPPPPLEGSGVALLAALIAGFWFWRQANRPGVAHAAQGAADAAAGQSPQAEQEWQAGVRDDPRFPDCYIHLGDLYLQQKRFPEAVAEYAAAARTDARRRHGLVPAALRGPGGRRRARRPRGGQAGGGPAAQRRRRGRAVRAAGEQRQPSGRRPGRPAPRPRAAPGRPGLLSRTGAAGDDRGRFRRRGAPPRPLAASAPATTPGPAT